MSSDAKSILGTRPQSDTPPHSYSDSPKTTTFTWSTPTLIPTSPRNNIIHSKYRKTHSDFPQSDTIHSKYPHTHFDFLQNNPIHLKYPPSPHTHSFWLLPKTTFMWGTPHSFWLMPKQRHSFKIPPPPTHSFWLPSKQQSPEVPHTHSDFPQSDTIHSKYCKSHSDFPQNSNIHVKCPHTHSDFPKANTRCYCRLLCWHDGRMAQSFCR